MPRRFKHSNYSVNYARSNYSLQICNLRWSNYSLWKLHRRISFPVSKVKSARSEIVIKALIQLFNIHRSQIIFTKPLLLAARSGFESTRIRMDVAVCSHGNRQPEARASCSKAWLQDGRDALQQCVPCRAAIIVDG